ncbi:MAG: restriction endonuclease subunit S [Leptonema illini]|uniref:Restriction endonuclease subunit S n=1 Tax=Leptonema illini TaxID=183 RepID=A0A833LXL8_9LEPT|nr:MAG: restriction endonuclease subunit S [Leptonema illini]
MGGEWKYVTVNDVAAPTRNAIVGGPFGSDLVSRDYTATGVPVIRGQNMGARWISGPFVFVSEIKSQSLAANLACPGDIVFTQRGTLGQVSLVPESSYRSYLISQSQMKLTVNPAVADPLFIYYLFISDEQQNYIRQHAIQTGVPHTNLGILRSTPIPLPPLDEQRAIAHILGTLDDKIELNRRMSQTLEEMARALFQSWFVDFDPVHAKAEGRWKKGQTLAGMPPEMWDLWPDSFEESELGPIPKGWSVGRLGDCIDLNPTRSLRKGEVAPYLDMANMPTQGHTPDDVVPRAFGSGMKFVNGDTLMARITPCLENGKTAFVDFLNEGQVGWGSTEYIVLRPRMPMPAEFAYCLARSSSFRDFAIQSMTGSSGRQRVPSEALSKYPLVIPRSDGLGLFGKYARVLLERGSKAVVEARKLSNLRDTLLPKLISGELRVKDADKFLFKRGIA